MTQDERKAIDDLLVKFGNAQFDCGEFDGSALSPDYDALCTLSDDLHAQILAEVDRLTGYTVPKSGAVP